MAPRPECNRGELGCSRPVNLNSPAIIRIPAQFQSVDMHCTTSRCSTTPGPGAIESEGDSGPARLNSVVVDVEKVLEGQLFKASRPASSKLGFDLFYSLVGQPTDDGILTAC